MPSPSTRSLWLAILSAATSAGIATPVITEIMADNNSALADDDGDFSDWIEIYNPTSETLDLSGWQLSDDPTLPARWLFPDGVSIPAGRSLIVFASGKDRGTSETTLHTNFKISAQGEQVILTSSDGSTSSSLSFPEIPEDVSFGQGFTNETFLIDPSFPVTFYIPADDSLGENWTAATFDDTTWESGTATLGFETGEPDPSDRAPFGYWSFDDDSDTSSALDESGGDRHGTISEATYTTDGGGKSSLPGDRALDFGTPTNNASVSIPDATAAFASTEENDSISISLWTFGGPELPERNNAFFLSAPGGATTKAHLPWSNGTIFWDTAGCCDSSTNRISKNEPDASNYQGQWNHYLFLKDGSRKEIWQNGTLFQSGTNTTPLTSVTSFWIGSSVNGSQSYAGLIDDVAVWDIPLTPLEISALADGGSPLSPLSFEDEFQTDLEASMSSTSASAFVRIPFQVTSPEQFDQLLLDVKYDDGFVVYLNGTEAARRNAPDDLNASTAAALTSRTKLASLTSETINLSSSAHLLTEGSNLLAIHALNHDVSGNDFLFSASLTGATALPDRFFLQPTPESPNNAGVAGFAPAPTFSHLRGFYSSPIPLTISGGASGASFIYTTDGSVPSLTSGTRIDPSDPEALASVTTTILNTTPVRVLSLLDDHADSSVASHTYLFAEQVPNQSNAPAGYPDTWGVYGDHGPFVGAPFPADYEVDPEIPASEITAGITSIPAVCISLPVDDLFDADNGIWSNSVEHGDIWEREASIEIIAPDGSSDFQLNAGLRINGGLSRQHHHAHKHSFRLNFRREYGETRLRYRLFEDSPVDNFDELVLRASSTDGWAVSDSGLYPKTSASYFRDPWVKDTQLSMGNPSGHSRFVNVFLNGLYFGQYNLAERNVPAWNVEYLGGEEEEYDVIKNAANLDSGSKDIWNAMMNLAESGLETEAAYQEMQGNDPSGNPDPNLPVYLDIDNFIDYMILHISIGSTDWPRKNWWASRHNSPDSEGFKFYVWDQEIALLSLTRETAFTNARYEEVEWPNTPAFLYDRLRQNPSFQARFSARAQELFFNGGVLSPEKNDARWKHRQAEIDLSIVAESARWGDSRSEIPFTREDHWLPAMDFMADTYWHENHAIAVTRFANVGLLPAELATMPNFSHSGGTIPENFSLKILSSDSEIYFTTDSTDPKAANDSVSPNAQLYSGSIPLPSQTTINARSLDPDSGTWSTLRTATYTPGIHASADNLSISEIHYNPAGDELEFIELVNFSTEEIDLGGVSFISGIEYIFPQGSSLPAGGRISISENEFTGKLDNGGDHLILLAENRDIINDFSYSDDSPWPEQPDGDSYSLTLLESTLAAPHLASSWRRSLDLGGTPGTSDSVSYTGPSPTADNDGDGLDAFTEHALGTSDNEQNTNPVSLQLIDGFINLTYPRLLAADDASVSIEISSDLIDWKQNETTLVSSTNTSVTEKIILPPSADHPVRFARIRVTAR